MKSFVQINNMFDSQFISEIKKIMIDFKIVYNFVQINFKFPTFQKIIFYKKYFFP